MTVLNGHSFRAAAARGGADDRGRGLLLNVLNGLRTERVVHWDDGHTGLEARERAHHPVAAVLEEEAEEATAVGRHRNTVELPQPGGNSLDARGDLRVGLPLVGSDATVLAHAAAEARRRRPRAHAVHKVLVQVDDARCRRREELVRVLAVSHDGTLARSADWARVSNL